MERALFSLRVLHVLLCLLLLALLIIHFAATDQVILMGEIVRDFVAGKHLLEDSL